MRMARARALSAFLMAALAGCALMKTPEEPAPAIEEVTPEPEAAPAGEAGLDRLLRYFRHVRRLGGSELVREHDSVRSAFARSRSEFDRLRLAMVLSLPNTPVSDEARALDLLEPVVKNQNSDFNGLALLMSSFLQEQRRLGAAVHGMQQKLDALKSMERSLIEREGAGAKRR